DRFDRRAGRRARIRGRGNGEVDEKAGGRVHNCAACAARKAPWPRGRDQLDCGRTDHREGKAARVSRSRLRDRRAAYRNRAGTQWSYGGSPINITSACTPFDEETQMMIAKKLAGLVVLGALSAAPVGQAADDFPSR